jgi:hypothetical protein
MSSRHYILADVELLPTDKGGRRWPIVQQFRCPAGIDDKLFDVVIDLSSIGSLSPGQSARLPMEFQRPDLVFPLLRLGSEFTLWESGTIGHGRVIEIYGNTAA